MARRQTTRKNKYRLDYRSNGQWYTLRDFPTRKEAVDYAKTSYSCKDGYQVVKLK